MARNLNSNQPATLIILSSLTPFLGHHGFFSWIVEHFSSRWFLVLNSRLSRVRKKGSCLLESLHLNLPGFSCYGPKLKAPMASCMAQNIPTYGFLARIGGLLVTTSRSPPRPATCPWVYWSRFEWPETRRNSLGHTASGLTHCRIAVMDNHWIIRMIFGSESWFLRLQYDLRWVVSFIVF